MPFPSRLLLFAFLLFTSTTSFAHVYVDWGAHALPLEEKIIEGVRIVQSQPPDLANVSEIPSVVQIRFTGHVDLAASTIVVTGPDGKVVNHSAPFIDARDTHTFAVEITNGGTGKYMVDWHVISSDDGHITEGSFSFFVGENVSGLHSAAPEPLSEFSYSSGVREGMSLWVEIVGEAILFGLFTGLIFIFRPVIRHYSAEARQMGNVCPDFSLLFLGGSSLILIGIALYLGLKTWELHEWSGKGLLPTFLLFLHTTAGTVALVRVMLVAICVFLFLRERKDVCERVTTSHGERILLCAILLLIFARASISHATATAFHPHLSVFIAFVHLASKLLLIGLTIAMTVTFLPAFGRMKNFGLLLLPLARFSRIASAAIVIGGVTGLYIVWILMKNPANLFTTEWGERSFFLLASAGALFFMRFSHYFSVRRTIRRVEARTISDEEARSNLIHSLFGESFIGILLLLTVGILIATATPPGKVGEGGLLFTVMLFGSSIPLIGSAFLLDALGRKMDALGS